MGTPVAELPDSATPFVPPAGEPADPDTSSEVIATLHQVFACANAADPLRVASLFTETSCGSSSAVCRSRTSSSFSPFRRSRCLTDQKRIIIRFGEVQLLPDGRAGVGIVLDEPADPRTEEPDYVILEYVEGRWLVDELHEDGGTAGTQVAGTPAA